MSKELKEGSWESRGAQKARREHGLQNFAAKSDPLRKSPLTVKWFRSLLAPFAKIFAAAKRSLGTRVPFCKPVHPFHSCEMAAKPPSLENPPFRSREAIPKGVSQLRNHPLAHECHFKASYTHFAAAKWLRNPPCLKILQRAHHEQTCHSRTPIGHISITSWSPFHAYYIAFQIFGSQEFRASNGAQFGVETKKL